MGGTTFIVLIVGIVMSCEAFRIWVKHRERMDGGTQRNKALLRRIDELQQRIEVLETIVTDHRYELNREIEALERDNVP